MSRGAEQLAVWASDALEAGDGAALQPLTQHVDALCRVGATSAMVEAAELIARATAADESLRAC